MLGGLYLLTGNLLAPFLAHAGINAVNLRLLGAWVEDDATD
jgi:membrane protease YdiL (CAAX protease family)